MGFSAAWDNSCSYVGHADTRGWQPFQEAAAIPQNQDCLRLFLQHVSVLIWYHLCLKERQEPPIKSKRTGIIDLTDNLSDFRKMPVVGIPFTDHPHIIGESGAMVEKLKAETNCSIHFPDRNKDVEQPDSNKVSISGEPIGLEKARAILRALIPVVITFEMPVSGFLQPFLINNSTPDIKYLETVYGLDISLQQSEKDIHIMVTERCTQPSFAQHKEGILKLMDYLYGHEVFKIHGPEYMSKIMLVVHQLTKKGSLDFEGGCQLDQDAASTEKKLSRFTIC